MNYQEIIKKLKSLSNPKNVEGMARYGINSKNTLGICMPSLMSLNKKIKKDHKLALQLWDSDIFEARLLAAMVDIPELVTEKQADKWVNDFDSWAVCDQACMRLFRDTKFAHKK
ncbi:DNA alkylation repair protein, partial [Candidatus Margulisiibacteriota bacterium]